MNPNPKALFGKTYEILVGNWDYAAFVQFATTPLVILVVLGPVIAALVWLVILAVNRRSLTSAFSSFRPTLVAGAILWALLLSAAALLAYVPVPTSIVLAAAALPSSMFIYAAIVQGFAKNAFLYDGGDQPVQPERNELLPYYDSLRDNETRYYTVPSLAMRLGLPAIILFTTITTVGLLLPFDRLLECAKFVPLPAAQTAAAGVAPPESAATAPADSDQTSTPPSAPNPATTAPPIQAPPPLAGGAATGEVEGEGPAPEPEAPKPTAPAPETTPPTVAAAPLCGPGGAPCDCALPPEWLLGAAFGALGAYLYTLVQVGTRTLRMDVTGTFGLWSAFTVAAGTVLGSVINYFIKDATVDGSWSQMLLPFGAGLSLRASVAFVQDRIRRGFGAGKGVPYRADPLSMIRGIDEEAEERLLEEGITNVARLAWCNPLRLVRSTSFDRRQVMAWIDEALLIMYAPTAWSLLQNAGVSGAVDLAWYRQYIDWNPTAGTRDIGQPIKDLVAALAKAQNNAAPITEDQLADLITRVGEDTQVLLVWAWYQYEGRGGGESTLRAHGPGAAAWSDFQPVPIELRYESAPPTESDGVAQHRRSADATTRGLYLTHRSRPSKDGGADVILWVADPRRAPLTGVESVTYFFGPSQDSPTLSSKDAASAFRVDVTLSASVVVSARLSFAAKDGAAASMGWAQRFIEVAVDPPPAPGVRERVRRWRAGDESGRE